MMTEAQYLNEYAQSHQNPLNQVIHVFCVPTIFFATLGLLWLVPVGRFIPGVSPELAPWINLATVISVPSMMFYAALSIGSLLTGVVWGALSYAGILAIEQAGGSLAWICGIAWVVAWAVQFYGHHVEGAKPSFAKDMLFLLVGPLFVQQKFKRWWLNRGSGMA